MRPKLPDTYIPSVYVELQALSAAGTAIASGVLTTANMAFYVPVVFPFPAQLYSISFVAANGTGNYDLGFYDGYSKTRIQSTTSTALTAAGKKTMTFTVDYAADPGKVYYAALSFSSTSGTVWCWTPAATVNQLIAGGVANEASALPLPATMTPVTATGVRVPIFIFGIR